LKDFFKNIQTLLIVVLVVIILLMRSCEGNSTAIEPEVITKIEVRYDTIETIKETYIPKWRTKIVTEIDTLQADIDTLAILKDYYAKYYYSDTLYIDTIGYAIINDTISRNTILARDIRTNILIPITTITKEIYLNKNEFYWGLGLQGRTDQLNYLGTELLWKNKKKQVYGFGIGVNQDFQPVLSGRMYWKIGK
jgi:hypothetical protein